MEDAVAPPTGRAIDVDVPSSEPQAREEPVRGARVRALVWFAGGHMPWLVVAAVVAFNLWMFRAEAHPPQYLNDSSIHESMVRWAAERLRAGHLPFDGWLPYLSLGVSKFHRYQALPAIATGALAIPFGMGVFALSNYLLLSLWPIAVYGAARLFELDRWEASVAAAVSPFLVSASALGYEASSYLWRGSGTWTQLWGMWLLPFALALTWRAIARDRSLALAAVTLAAAASAHLLTGYLAFACVPLFVLVAPREWRRRTWRALLVILGGLGAAAWMIVPLLTDRAWTSVDEFSRGTYFYDSFGAKRVLAWLFSGKIFDAGRVPVISLLVAAGFVVVVARWRAREGLRAISLVGGASLVLFFGRPTLGPLVDLLPGGENLFLRRYIIGVQFAGIMLAGVGGAWLGHFLLRRLADVRPSWGTLRRSTILAAAGLIALSPVAIDRYAFAAQGAGWMTQQHAVDQTLGAQFASLVEKARAFGGGRIFSGSRTRPSTIRKMGQVPDSVALLNDGADGVGFTRPTWSLLSDVEARFAPYDAAQYDLFGIRWMIWPRGQTTPVPGSAVASTPAYTLYRVQGATGYLGVGDAIASIPADRTDIGQQMSWFLTSGLPAAHQYPTVGFNGARAAAPTLRPNVVPSGPVGIVLSSQTQLTDGRFAGTVKLDRAGIVLLKASFDPRFGVTVDGVSRSLVMVAPGYPAVVVPAGTHQVVFAYHPYPHYPELAGVGLAALVALVVLDRVSRRRRRSRLMLTAT